MRSIALGILEAGETRDELVAEHGTYSEWYERFFRLAEDEQLAFRFYRALAGELPSSATECDAYVITGSPASVVEPEPWMHALQDFVRESAAVRPHIGICFGHQLIAEAYGGKVERAARGWGVGVHTYEVRETRSWMAPPLESFSILASHSDQVTRPPPGAEVLAGSEFCPYGALQIAPNILTIQNHPEMSKAFAAALYRLREPILGAPLVREALASMDLETDEKAISRWLVGFLREQLG